MKPMMPNMFEYKGYVGRLTVDADDHLIHGLVINIARDTITFRGETPTETKQDLQETIDEYLADCITDGIETDVPISHPLGVSNFAPHER